MWTMRYRFTISEVTGGINEELLSVGYGGSDIQSDIKTLNEAITSAMSFVRRFDAVGKDVQGVVFGQPQGSDVATPAMSLSAAPSVVDEDTYATLDSMPRYLKRRIALANKTATDAFGLPPADIEAEGGGIEA